MNRRERRKRMKVLKGGKPDADDQKQPGLDLNTPAGRFAARLDDFCKGATRADGALAPEMMLAVLLRYAAAIVVSLDQPAADVLRALDVFIDQEREVRGAADSDKTPPGGSA